MSDLSAFYKFLKEEEVDEETLNILKNENVCARTLPDITENDLKEMNIKLGPRKRLMQIIKAANENETHIASPCAPEMLDQPCSFLLSNYMDSQKESHQISEIEQPCSSQFEEINVRKWVECHRQGKDLIKRFEEETYKVEDRQLLVRIVCAEMMKICGSAYPSSELKLAVAKRIIAAFPSLKSKNFAKGHESFYDAITGHGFLEYRLKTVRKSLSPSKKRRCMKKKPLAEFNNGSLNLLDKAYLEEKVLWMQLKNPTEANKKYIEEALIETMPNRQEEILSSCMTATDILLRYPRLQDYKGEMIDKEFTLKYPDCDSFLGKFSSFYVPRIIKYVEIYKPHLLKDVLDLDDNFKALLLLPELLPNPNYGKGKGKKGQGKTTKVLSEAQDRIKTIPRPELLLFANSNDDLLNLAGRSPITQPYLICAVEENRRSGQFFIKLDHKLIEVESHAIKAFDILFKLHFALNIHYAHQLTNFYDFVAGCVYKISKPKPCCDALDACLYNIPIDLNKVLV